MRIGIEPAQEAAGVGERQKEYSPCVRPRVFRIGGDPAISASPARLTFIPSLCNQVSAIDGIRPRSHLYIAEGGRDRGERALYAGSSAPLLQVEIRDWTGTMSDGRT